jgi:hypothetical protein
MFNTGIGQHILKNPLIVNSIIDKVGVREEREKVIGLFILLFRLLSLPDGSLLGQGTFRPLGVSPSLR